MPRGRHQSSVLKVRDDLAFPLPFRQQSRFLELADTFLDLNRAADSGNVVPIDASHNVEKAKWEKAS